MIRTIRQYVYISCLAATLVLFLASTTSAHEKPAAHGTSAQAIEQVMKAQFDKPEAPLTVVPVTVEGDYAIAGWIQHDRGGRALLKAEGGNWTFGCARVMACSKPQCWRWPGSAGPPPSGF